MNIDEIAPRRERIIEHFEPWTAHCIHLADDVYTWPELWPTPRLRRYLEIASDTTDKPLHTPRVLDLACLEARFGIEFNRHFTVSSLCNLLHHLGFLSIYEWPIPHVPGESEDRITLMAIRGRT